MTGVVDEAALAEFPGAKICRCTGFEARRKSGQVWEGGEHLVEVVPGSERNAAKVLSHFWPDFSTETKKPSATVVAVAVCQVLQERFEAPSEAGVPEHQAENEPEGNCGDEGVNGDRHQP